MQFSHTRVAERQMQGAAAHCHVLLAASAVLSQQDKYNEHFSKGDNPGPSLSPFLPSHYFEVSLP